MVTLLILALTALGVFMLCVMLHGAFSGRVEFLSARNLIFASFLVFQISSGLFTLTGHVPTNFHVGDLQRGSAIYVLYAWLVVPLFMLFYRWRPGVDRLIDRMPKANAVPAEPVVWLFVIVLLVVALAMRVMVRIPAVGVLSSMIGAALAASAGGLAAWIWIRRPWNPIAVVYFLAALAAACLIAQIGTTGRRNVLCVLLCAAWVVYYTKWIHLTPGSIMRRLVLFAIPAFLFLAALSTVRHNRTASVVEIGLRVFTASDLKRGVLELVYGQEAAVNSMWLIENVPDRVSIEPMQSFYMIVLTPIPRIVWPDKPESLGSTFVRYARVQGVPHGYSVGPGIIGHIVDDGGWYALLVYTAAGGFFVALVDRTSLRNLNSPFALAALGAGLGHLAAVPRGDVTVFGWLAFLGLFAPWFGLVLISKALVAMGLAAKAEDHGEFDEQADDPDSLLSDHREQVC